MARRMEAAQARQGVGVCARCLREKPRCVALVADAGQFFEAVAPPQAIEAARRVLQHCVGLSGKVTVKGRRKRTCFMGGSPTASHIG